MHNPNKIIAGVPDSQQVATAVNGAATVTLSAPGARNQWLIQAITISMNGDPAAAANFTIVSGGSTTLERIDFPAAACAPYNSRGLYVGGVNEAVVCSLGALGSGIRGTVSVRAMKIPANSA